jgi:glycosyltransferase involved in cell wall biosynthesis
MIAKNEAGVILRCLESARDMVDFVLIEDTGSTDGTEIVVRDWLAKVGLDGEVYGEPWRDFAYNRSHALETLRKRRNIDYALILDADDYVVREPQFEAAAFKAGLRHDVYSVQLRNPPISFKRHQICSNRIEMKYRGVLHEFLEAPPGASIADASGFHIVSTREGARSRDPDKYSKDAAILERALLTEDDEFLRSRYTFYLGRSYDDAGQKEKALENYLKREKLKFWSEEIFMSLYAAGHILRALDRPVDEVLSTFDRASKIAPGRAEAFHASSRLRRDGKRFAEGYEYARRGLAIPMPREGLFVVTWIYDYGLLDELAINAYWAGRHAECIEACDQLLSEGKLPAGERDRVQKNREFAVSKSKDALAERFVTLLDAARAKEQAGESAENVIAAYVTAAEACPARAEALHAAARFCRYRNLFQQGYEFAKQGMLVARPDEAPFDAAWIYDYGLRDEFAVNAYWIEHYAECLEACDRLLTESTLPANQVDRVRRNREFAAKKIGSRTGAAFAVSKASAPQSANGEAEKPSWKPASAMAGTQLMIAGLREHYPAAFERLQLEVNLFPKSRAAGKPLVLWFHHDINQDAVQWCEDKTLIERVDKCVFVSDWQKERYRNRFSIPSEKCVVLRNATASSDKKRLWIDSRPIRFAYTSTPFRGLDVLLDAWELLNRDDCELHVWSSMALYDMDDSRYAPLIERCRETRNVSYHGVAPNAELKAALRNIHFLSYPCTFEETSCLAAIDAMSQGCRLIIPSMGALPETTAGFASLYSWSGDRARHVKAFAAAIADEIANPWLGSPERSLGQQDYCEAVYDWRQRAAEWRHLVESLT